MMEENPIMHFDEELVKQWREQNDNALLTLAMALASQEHDDDPYFWDPKGSVEAWLAWLQHRRDEGCF
jgi:hypothetical protein